MTSRPPPISRRPSTSSASVRRHDLSSLARDGECVEPRDGVALLESNGGLSAHAAALRRLDRFAAMPYPVLVRGETGTGKELAAKRVHQHSPRRAGPFVAINCAAISESLAESELFGHRRGSFTGAHRDHAGAFERAAGGTLFLDEVAELPLPLQAKLLRVLEVERFTPVGAERDQLADVRIVAATHRDLDAMVSAGDLRADFIFRLSVLEVELPPLRRRLGDIESLIRTFVGQVAAETGQRVDVSDEAIAAAKRHGWPGNVRELKNTIRRAAALCSGEIRPDDLFPRPMPIVDAADSQRVTIPRGSYCSMRRAMLQAVLAREGSVRKTAQVLKVARSTVSDWLRSTSAAPHSSPVNSPKSTK